MPTKKKKRTSSPKKASSTKSKMMSAPVSKNVYSLSEQDEFYQQHPNAKNLIAAFIILVLLLAGLYFSKYGFAAMPV